MKPKLLLAQAGLPVPTGRVASSLAEASVAITEISGPVVLKAQIPSGRRMKAGGVRFAQTPEAALAAAEALLAASFYNFTVERVLIEEKLEVAREIFIAVTYDSGARTALLLASLAGGIEIESAENVVRRPFSLRREKASCVIIVSPFLGGRPALTRWLRPSNGHLSRRRYAHSSPGDYRPRSGHFFARVRALRSQNCGRSYAGARRTACPRYTRL
ncbi:MAG: ATP-grasp domain-containing protein [Anaerolineae bacterium]